MTTQTEQSNSGLVTHTGAIVHVPLDRIVESTTNPRRHAFDKTKLAELTESVRRHGILQPILLRPRGAYNHDPKDRFEVVCGARRFRAAKDAELVSIPASVVTLADQEVLEIQVIENLQREDLHPLEEAEGYRTLCKMHGYTAEQLAAKVGKSKAYIYARMKLCALPEAAKKLFWDNKLDASRALLVARIPDPKQAEKAAKEITKVDAWRGGVMGYREAREHIQHHYMLELRGAPFDVKDASLVPAAGACAVCPKRTGNQPDIFGDCRADVCTDPACYRGKTDAQWAREKASAEARGVKVIEGKAAEHIDLEDRGGHPWWDEKKRSWAKLLKDVDVPTYLVRTPHGDIRKGFKPDEAIALARKAGLKIGPREGTRQVNASGQEIAQVRQHRLRLKAIKATVVELVAKAEALKNPKAFLRFVAEEVTGGGLAVDVVARRRGLSLSRGYAAPVKKRKEALDQMTDRQLVGLIVEIIATDSPYGPYAGYGRGWTAACALCGIDMKARERAVAKEAPAKKKAAKKPAKAAIQTVAPRNLAKRGKKARNG